MSQCEVSRSLKLWSLTAFQRTHTNSWNTEGVTVFNSSAGPARPFAASHSASCAPTGCDESYAHRPGCSRLRVSQLEGSEEAASQGTTMNLVSRGGVRH